MRDALYDPDMIIDTLTEQRDAARSVIDEIAAEAPEDGTGRDLSQRMRDGVGAENVLAMLPVRRTSGGWIVLPIEIPDSASDVLAKIADRKTQ